MPKFGMRKVNSLRETCRFKASDQFGVVHTVVERVAMETPITFAVRYDNATTGVKSYYSSTSGDKLIRLEDGSFQGCDGRLKLVFVSLHEAAG